jgi:hypothetical protein
MELIETTHPDLYHQPSLQRFDKSLARMKRISNALLWLTSKDECKIAAYQLYSSVCLPSQEALLMPIN